MTDAPLAVTFDFGQTLADLDTAMLANRLGERGIRVSREAIADAEPSAWRLYNDIVRRGQTGHPWKFFMAELLRPIGMADDVARSVVDWLWDEQPLKNLWRRPVQGMIQLARDLRHASVPLGIISNSEGHLAELVAEIGWSDTFPVVADSGKLGLEKPSLAIFEWAARALGTPLDRIVHVGDSHAADVDGALRAGMWAIWFRGESTPDLGGEKLHPRMRVAANAADVRALCASFGLL